MVFSLSVVFTFLIVCQSIMASNSIDGIAFHGTAISIFGIRRSVVIVE